MATDFSGTNTERVDKLVVSLTELRTTMRLCLAAVGLGGPFMVGLLTFLVVQSFGTAARGDRLGDRVDRLEQKVDQLGDRVGRLEQKVDQLGDRVGRLEQKVDRLEQKVDRLEQKVDRLEQKVDRLVDALAAKAGKP